MFVCLDSILLSTKCYSYLLVVSITIYPDVVNRRSPEKSMRFPSTSSKCPPVLYTIFPSEAYTFPVQCRLDFYLCAIYNTG